MKIEDKQVKITHSLLSGFIQCDKNNPDCDLMTWVIANQDLARVIKTPDIPNVISLRAQKAEEITQICDNMSKICNTAKKICYNCAEKQK